MNGSRALRSLALLGLVALSGACMFKVKHELPPNTYFGSLPPAADEVEESFARGGMKNWALAGLIPYSSWGTADLLEPEDGVRRVDQLEVQTSFSRIDTVIWVIPGFAYGYYLWAPRHIDVSGRKIREQGPPK